MAEEPQEGSSKTTIEKAQKTVVPLPSLTHNGRLSTRDRWRGTPYLRSSADETLRSHALDVALPSANPAFQGGLNLQQHPTTFTSEDAVRNEALDKALPPANPAFVGGGAFASEHAVRTEALDKALPPANSAFVGGSTGGFGF
jgi:hypothetical protein